MDIINCQVALGGDKGNTVPRYRITVAEAAVLRAIHGDDGLQEVEVVGQADINPRNEMSRLKAIYRARNEEGEFVVEKVYPGANPPVHALLEDLQLPDECMKADRTLTAKPERAIDMGEDIFG